MWNQFYNGDNNSVAQIYFKIKALQALCELVTVLRIVQSLFERLLIWRTMSNYFFSKFFIGILIRPAVNALLCEKSLAR